MRIYVYLSAAIMQYIATDDSVHRHQILSYSFLPAIAAIKDIYTILHLATHAASAWLSNGR